MWTVSDETLVAGLAAGDRDAASAFVQRFQRRVFGLARTIVLDDRAAEDIAQEAFVRAWKHAGGYDPRRGSVVGWLLTITRNLAIDAVRVRVPGRDRSRRRCSATTPRRVNAGPVSTPSWPTTASACASRSAGLPEEQSRAVVLAGLLGLHRARGRRDGGHPARHGQDPHPHRAAPTPGRARDRGASEG